MATSTTALALTAALALLVSLASGHDNQTASDDSPGLRFVQQLTIRGCPVFVHDTGVQSAGPHLAVEPIMCVTESVRPRYDPVVQQTYVSVPLMLRDDAMLAEVERHLTHLSPKSVKFATVTDISVSTDASSVIEALGFVWSPQESIGFLRLQCKAQSQLCSDQCLSAKGEVPLKQVSLQSLSHVLLAANITVDGSSFVNYYHPVLQNSSCLGVGNCSSLSLCRNLRFIRSILLDNCTVHVHQRLDMKGHYLIEPLLCHNITAMTNESVLYDYSIDKHYLKLELVLQDEATVDAVRTQLADLEPRSVAFMRLWRAQSSVAPALSRRFVIGPLMVSGDWKSAQVRVYCNSIGECKRLRSGVSSEPVDLWQHIQWSAISLVADRCLLESVAWRYSWRMQERGGASALSSCTLETSQLMIFENLMKIQHSKFILVTSDGKKFVKIQQRLTGRVSFQRTWIEYERGFGDETDFWIGLSLIHKLSKNGVTLRVEMKLWNGTELHAEFPDFKVGDAATNYTMTVGNMLRDRSSNIYDAMNYQNGTQFSTMDRDNDKWPHHCSNEFGKVGWWMNACSYFYANGVIDGSASEGSLTWYEYARLRFLPLKQVRLMLQIL